MKKQFRSKNLAKNKFQERERAVKALSQEIGVPCTFLTYDVMGSLGAKMNKRRIKEMDDKYDELGEWLRHTTDIYTGMREWNRVWEPTGILHDWEDHVKFLRGEI